MVGEQFSHEHDEFIMDLRMNYGDLTIFNQHKMDLAVSCCVPKMKDFMGFCPKQMQFLSENNDITINMYIYLYIHT